MKKNYNDKIRQNAAKKNMLHKNAIILGALAAGLFCIIIITLFPSQWQNGDNWRIFLIQFFSTVAMVAFASVAWEAIIKYPFSRDVVDMVGLADSIKASGTSAIEESFSDINWEDLLENANTITAVFCYSTRWGKDYQEYIKKVIQNNGAVAILLPDKEVPELMDSLKYRFTGVTNLEDRIKEAEEFYCSLGASIEHFTKAITCSFYIIDECVGIMAPFNHQKAFGGHAPTVPAFICKKPGFMYSYIEKEVAGIREITDQN